LIASVPRPPVSMIPNINEGPRLDFFKAAPGCMGIVSRNKFAIAAYLGGGLSSVKTAGGPTETGGQLYLTWGNGFYTPPVLFNLVKNFERVISHETSIIWTTRVSTAVNGVVQVAYFDDPEFIASVGFATGVTPLDETVFVNCANTNEHPVYTNWRHKATPPTRGQPMYYTACSNPNAAYNFATNAANNRLNTQGLFAVFMPTVVANALISVADIWIETKLSLCVMSNPQTVAVTMKYEALKVLENERLRRQYMSQLEELKLPDEFVEGLGVIPKKPRSDSLTLVDSEESKLQDREKPMERVLLLIQALSDRMDAMSITPKEVEKRSSSKERAV